jgi:hypothetical protein
VSGRLRRIGPFGEFVAHRFGDQPFFVETSPMTQLCFFDACDTASVGTPPTAGPSSAVRVDRQAAKRPRRAAASLGENARGTDARGDEAPPRSLQALAAEIREGNARVRLAERSGVQRMGDLAKTVLMRHDLMARRRAARAHTEPTRRQELAC